MKSRIPIAIAALLVALGLALTVASRKDSAPATSPPAAMDRPTPSTTALTPAPASDPTATGQPPAAKLQADLRKPPKRSPSALPPAASEDQLLEQALARLKKGNLAYRTPQKMKTGEVAQVAASIASDKVPLSTLRSSLPTEPGGETEIEPTPISTRMKVTLTSADFDITPLSSGEQFVAGDTPTTWAWEISPRHAGKLHLHLAAVVEVNMLTKDFTTVDRDIAVHVDPINVVGSFVKANAVWILTSMGAGLAGLWTWLRRKKKKTDSSWETP